jgi:hypothetical protein
MLFRPRSSSFPSSVISVRPFVVRLAPPAYDWCSFPRGRVLDTREEDPHRSRSDPWQRPNGDSSDQPRIRIFSRLDSVARRAPVLVVDLADSTDVRWPAYSPAMVAHQIRGVSALPVVIGGEYVGALDLFRASPRPLGADQLIGALMAAELAQRPVLDIIDSDLQSAVSDPDSDAWIELTALSRVEVSQATGMLVAQLRTHLARSGGVRHRHEQS